MTVLTIVKYAYYRNSIYLTTFCLFTQIAIRNVISIIIVLVISIQLIHSDLSSTFHCRESLLNVFL